MREQPTNRKGYRGYIGTRMEMGRSVPQHIQQMVMRDYCSKNAMTYLLAAVEYRMTGCTMILDAVMAELPSLQGIVMYSLFLMPRARAKRMELYGKVFEAGATLHAAAENITIANWQDAMRSEENWLVHDVMRGQDEADLAYLTQWDKCA